MKTALVVKFLKTMVLLIIVGVAGFTGGYFLSGLGLIGGNDEIPGSSAEASELSRVKNILIVGIDAREGEKITRADTIMVASADPVAGRIAVISIPRDTRVDVNGPKKINEVLPLQGIDALRGVVGDLLGISIENYALLDFRGFEKVVDTLGGVTIDVEKNMYYRADDILIDLKKGVQELNGNQALQYVRFRHDALGDITRTERQQKFITAMVNEAFQLGIITKAPRLVPQLIKALETDLSLGEILALGNTLRRVGPSNVMTATLPGNFATKSGISYWIVDPQQSRLVVSRLMEGMTVATFNTELQQPESPTKEEPKPSTNAPLEKPVEETTNPFQEGSKNPGSLKPGAGQPEEPGEVQAEPPLEEPPIEETPSNPSGQNLPPVGEPNANQMSPSGNGEGDSQGTGVTPSQMIPGSGQDQAEPAQLSEPGNENSPASTG